MIKLIPDVAPGGALRVLCLGAHSDDIEIGCSGTLLRWQDEYPAMEVLWVVFGASEERAGEARLSVERLLDRVGHKRVVIGDFVDGRLPAEYSRAKDFVSALKASMAPDVVFTHQLDDRHQDHRLIGELTWQTWRDHLILEYEIPKYEGDLGRPNAFVALDDVHRDRKLRHLAEHFGTQRPKDWFDDETFRGLMRLRGVECRARSGYAEAFHLRKLTF